MADGPVIQRAGQAALDGPEWASRLVMFRVYYLGLAPYDNARHFLGLSERSWVNWSEEIRRRCGAELLRRGMFPPRKYFRSGTSCQLGSRKEPDGRGANVTLSPQRKKATIRAQRQDLASA